MIYVAHDIGRTQPHLDLIDVQVARNAFGRQIDSFETDLPMPVLGEAPFPAVFIRAPMISQTGPGVQTLARACPTAPSWPPSRAARWSRPSTRN